MDLERFVRAFGFKVVRINDGRYHQRIDHYNPKTASYYSMYDHGTVEMEIGRKELEHMADYFYKMEDVNKRDHADYVIRRENPAVQEAYSKYQMLLELYR